LRCGLKGEERIEARIHRWIRAFAFAGGRQPAQAMDGVSVKVPFPLQPPVLLAVQVPDIVLPFTVPLRVSIGPFMFGVAITIPNVPIILPLEFPVRLNDPLSPYPSGGYEAKHEPAEVNVKLVTLKPPLAL
jgi:hypothetical protein